MNINREVMKLTEEAVAYRARLATAGNEIDCLRAEIERLRAALDRYRYAVRWASADSWDAGGEMRVRFYWALGEDIGANTMTDNHAAEIGQQFLRAAGHRTPPCPRTAGNR